MRILVVENSQRMQEAMRTALESFGTVTLTGSADEARSALKAKDPFDIVFTDYHMRGGSGLEVIDHVRHHHPGTPVVLITAYGTKELTIECLNRHIFRFLEKPVKYSDIKDIMIKAMEMRERSLTEKRINTLGKLSNLIFHEIGGSLQDLLNETLSIDLGTRETPNTKELSSRFLLLRDNINRTSDALRNLKFLILEERLETSALEDLDLSLVVASLKDWLDAMAQSYNIQVEIKLPDGPAPIRGLPGLIQRAVKNVLINAMEALSARSGSRILKIELSASKKGYLLEIANNGPMIPMEIRDRIFDFAISSKDAEPIPRGIGLYVTNRVMKTVGGELRFESDPDWTRFTLAFPSA